MKEISMYMRIQNLKEAGWSKRRTATFLNVSRNTVAKYWSMTVEDFNVLSINTRKGFKLAKYETVVVKWLADNPGMSSAQVEDWILEHYHEKFKTRTVSRFVSMLRKNNDIPKNAHPREYEAVEELPMGYQIQVDFGEMKLRNAYSGTGVKVHFVLFVLSHSRYKWGYFLDRPFCTKDLIICMDLCFIHMGGMTKELVFDQDHLMTVSENYGDIIHTYEFEQYRQEKKFKLYLCKKADPETKGKIEAGVKYVKYNFLEYRTFMNIDILNRSFEDWLDRTGNAKVHGTTKKIPAEVFAIERKHLIPVLNIVNTSFSNIITRRVRKDNTIIFNSNRYSVPFGTYTKHKKVNLEVDESTLVITDIFGDVILASHKISMEKGKLVKNTNHSRDKSSSIIELQDSLENLLENKKNNFLQGIKKNKPRYLREQFTLLGQLIKNYTADKVIAAVDYCEEHELYSAVDVRDALEYFESKKEKVIRAKLPLKVNSNTGNKNIDTQKRSVKEYSSLEMGRADE